MMVLDMLVVLVLAAAAGSGVGGGGLLVVYLTLVRGFEQVPAQAINLAVFILAALSSAAVQWKQHRLPPWRLIAVTVLVALPGVWLGTRWRDAMDAGVLRIVFGLFLLLAAALVLWREGKGLLAAWKTKKFRAFSVDSD